MHNEAAWKYAHRFELCPHRLVPGYNGRSTSAEYENILMDRLPYE